MHLPQQVLNLGLIELTNKDLSDILSTTIVVQKAPTKQQTKRINVSNQILTSGEQKKSNWN